MEFEIKTSRTGEKPIKLGRINVFLGANGTGKSKLLEELKGTIDQVLPDHKVLNIEGGRALKMFDSLELDRNNYNNYKTYEQTYQGYQSKRSGTLQSRLFDGLKTLEQLAESAKIEHSDAVTRWLASEAAKTDPENVPRRPVDPMSRVFESFSDIFPAISLRFYPSERRLRCTKNGSRYGPTSLSEGEKQVFSVLVDVVELADQKTVLFVDEPELNLHPSLANSLWSSVESLLPEAVFIYATHSVSFAMREAVERLLVLSDSDDNIQELDNLADLSSKDKKELLGNITSLIASKMTLLVEGEDESFDSIFYNWVIGDSQISPTAVGGCEDVLAIAERSGKWSYISPNVTLSGIVDRDYKSQKDIQNIEDRGVVVLDVHEAESYLCCPQVLIAIAKAVGTTPAVPTADEILQVICNFVEGMRLKIVARRVAAQLSVRIGVSVPSKTLNRISTNEQLKTLLMEDVRQQKERVSETYQEQLVSGLIDSEAKALQGAVEGRDVSALLALAPGKELLGLLASRAGCVDANSVARAARHHLSLDDYPSLQALRAKILSAFPVEEFVPKGEGD